MLLSEFDYHLPEHLIAQKPLDKRDMSRLLVLSRENGNIEEKVFKDIISYFQKGDVLVLNETQVIPARLIGERETTKSPVEVFLVKELEQNLWEVLVKPGRKMKIGDAAIFGYGIGCRVEKIEEDGSRIVRFFGTDNIVDDVEKVGKMPLPPYIKREAEKTDVTTYQTVFAKKAGAVAAPTAGLHFTDKLLTELENKGVKIVKVLLHVGLGTFRPVSVEKIEDHEMHKEYFEVSKDTADIVNSAKKAGARVIACGTTCVRTLESATNDNGVLEAISGDTGIFIYPSYKFKMVDALITNFHLPKSTLMMLISAFSSIENVKKAYSYAVDKEFRFFSYGDAMLII